MNKQTCDILIRNALVFNDTEIPEVQDVAIARGKIFERGNDLSAIVAATTINADGLWLMPGLFDIHTHYDLELELEPSLPESLRHGTTSVVIANCSLGLAFGAQRVGDSDPIVDCYARVENIPKHVLKKCADKVTWDNPGDYIKHLASKIKGPNVVTMVPHSMLRIEAMGFEGSITRDPTHHEMNFMCSALRGALRQGYAGFSTDALPFHYLANKPNTDKTIPTQFAKYDELKRLTEVVREEDRTWQATPPKDNPFATLKTFLLTSGRLHGKPLKTTVVAAMDLANNRKVIHLARLLSRLLNSKLVDGRFYMQALGARFKTWSDGPLTPLAEEIPELRMLNEADLEDRKERMRLLSDQHFVKAFKKMWLRGKAGYTLARLLRLLRLEDYAFDRKLENMYVEVCPIEKWQGLNFAQVFGRVRLVRRGKRKTSMGEAEYKLIREDFDWVSDEADFMLQMLRSFDTKLSWSTVSANRDLDTVRELIMDKNLLPGFNDSGAHLTNMAFYDANLRSLQLAMHGGDDDVAYMVKRLTKDAADVFNVEAGTIYPGDVADVILVDPRRLEKYDGENSVNRIYRDVYETEQLVNRSKGVVRLVIISGKIAWVNNRFSDQLGKVPMGRLLVPTADEKSEAA